MVAGSGGRRTRREELQRTREFVSQPSFPRTTRTPHWSSHVPVSVSVPVSERTQRAWMQMWGGLECRCECECECECGSIAADCGCKCEERSNQPPHVATEKTSSKTSSKTTTSSSKGSVLVDFVIVGRMGSNKQRCVLGLDFGIGNSHQYQYQYQYPAKIAMKHVLVNDCSLTIGPNTS
eukprot:CAMPEP_0172385932 /NCGR_PEP_ID=MMETSP1061-20121228/3541_1 /TAXON_ID=37318 /ORGANISM="Pseudo-nitzschia pungens, Strain cf. pungens" /LENGTH=178 /DNA_ID=CAMNT_0013115127 /DNA_START=93 /DNA_END=626 /DNA_ORIENTATION=+